MPLAGLTHSGALGIDSLPRALVACFATLDYGCVVLIDRNDIPKHLFGIPDLVWSAKNENH
jgi:hypothetical protein